MGDGYVFDPVEVVEVFVSDETFVSDVVPVVVVELGSTDTADEEGGSFEVPKIDEICFVGAVSFASVQNGWSEVLTLIENGVSEPDESVEFVGGNEIFVVSAVPFVTEELGCRDDVNVMGETAEVHDSESEGSFVIGAVPFVAIVLFVGNLGVWVSVG